MEGSGSSLIWLIIVIALGFWVAHRLRDYKTRKNQPPKLLCSCEHPPAAHRSGFRCQESSKRIVRWERDRKLDDPGYVQGLTTKEIEGLESVPVEWQLVQCPCPLYDGPEPPHTADTATTAGEIRS